MRIKNRVRKGLLTGRGLFMAKEDDGGKRKREAFSRTIVIRQETVD